VSTSAPARTLAQKVQGEVAARAQTGIEPTKRLERIQQQKRAARRDMRAEARSSATTELRPDQRPKPESMRSWGGLTDVAFNMWVDLYTQRFGVEPPWEKRMTRGILSQILRKLQNNLAAYEAIVRIWLFEVSDANYPPINNYGHSPQLLMKYLPALMEEDNFGRTYMRYYVYLMYPDKYRTGLEYMYKLHLCRSARPDRRLPIVHVNDEVYPDLQKYEPAERKQRARLRVWQEYYESRRRRMRGVADDDEVDGGGAAS
jgi:hypothetical protein